MSYLTEAFRQLNLTEDVFSLDAEDMRDVTDMLNKTDEKEEITMRDVIDTDADDNSELKDNYIGQVILECPICHTLIYKDKDNIDIDEETETVNVDESCPVCLSEEGFHVIGQVAAFDFDEDSDIDVTVDGEEVEVEDSEEESDKSEDDDLEESLKNHSLKEAVKAKVNIKRRGRKLQEKKWEYQLKCGKALRDAIENFDEDDEDSMEDVRSLIVEAWNELATQFPDEDCEAEAENVEMIDLEPDEIDYCLNDLYDFCDNLNVWIPLTDIDESLTEAEDKHLETKKRTLAQQLNQPEIKDKVDRIIGDSLKFWKARRDELISLIKTLDVSEDTKDGFIKKLRNAKTEGVFLSTIAAFMSGMRVSDKKKDESLSEGFNDVQITTDDQKLTMSQDSETQKVTVTTEPVEEVEEEVSIGEDETLAPLDLETEETIEATDEVEEPEEVTDEEVSEEETDEEETGEEGSEDIEEFDEESFDDLGESYLKKVYDNVSSYKTTNISSPQPNKIMIEGIITFTSGNKKATKFIFEAANKTSRGKLKFLGENLNITRGKKSFVITGSNNKGKFLSESLNYKYMVNGNNISGRVKR